MSRYVFDKRRWAKLTIFEQMANIGAEVGRAFKAKKQCDADGLRGAVGRGLELFDVTAESLAQEKSPRTNEVLRAREMFLEAIMTDQDDPALEDYFMQYAIAARLHHG